MKVRVDELSELGKVIHFREPAAWFSSRMNSAEDAREITLEQPVNVDLELVGEKDQVKITGQLQATVRLGCSRCLQNFVAELDEHIELVLLRFLPDDTSDEIDLRSQDLDTEFYDGVTIDVDLIVAEQIFLSLPQKPICNSECRGLCSGCGADLNRELCRCEKRETGSTFDALRSLKLE